MSIREMASTIMPPAMRRVAGKALRGLRNKDFDTSLSTQDMTLSELTAEYDVIIMKHCFPSSDVLEDIGNAEPSFSRQSLENYMTVYRKLREQFDRHPDNLFIVWTLPPRHRLFEPKEGNKDENAARATAFSDWLKAEYPLEDGMHPNICVWDFRSLMTEKGNNFLKQEYEINHRRPDSHPNKLANNTSGPELAKFLVNSLTDFYGNSRKGFKIVFLHHSTGYNVFQYPSQGLKSWLDEYNTSYGTNHYISEKWYPGAGNMPVHYYQKWIEG
jgi:hypothetical protein